MEKTHPITTLFLDIGGVLLSDGWDHHARRRAANKFALNIPEMESRHHLTFYTYEEGKLTLEDYIENTPMFVQIAEGLGIRSILHKDYDSTRAELDSLGLKAAAAGVDVS